MRKELLELRKSGIYKITNTVNGKSYVGSSVNIWSRWCLHKRQLLQGIHHSIKLQRAWNMYGSESFSFSVVELVENKNQLLDREQFWLDSLDSVKSGYNINRNARNSLGTMHRPETKEKISQFFKGRKLSKEHIAKRTASQTGIKRTPETIEKMSKVRLGTKASQSAIENMRLAKLGVRQTAEAIAKGRETYIKNRRLVDPGYRPIQSAEEKRERQRLADRRSYEKRKEELNAKARKKRAESKALREALGYKRPTRPKRPPEADRLARIENQRRYAEKNRDAINARRRESKSKSPA